MDTRNHEHYKDKTAHDAIKAADRLPDTIGEMRAVANKRGFEVFGRIKLRDLETGKIYRQRERGGFVGKVSPDPVLRYASGDKRVKETHKNDGGEDREN